MSSQPVVRPTDASSHPQNSRAQDQPTGASLPPSTDVAPTRPAVHAKYLPRTAEPHVEESKLEQASLDNPEPCSAPSLEFRRGTRSRRPPDRYGEWDLNSSNDADIDIYFIWSFRLVVFTIIRDFITSLGGEECDSRNPDPTGPV